MAIRFLEPEQAPQEEAKGRIRFVDESPSQPVMPSALSQMLNAGKEGFKKSGEALGSTDMSAPSRVLQGVGNIAAIPFEAGTVAVERGLNELGMLPALAKANKTVYDKAVPNKAKEGIAAILDLIGGAVQKHPEAAENVKAALDIAGAVPIAGEVAQPLGRVLEGAGKSALASSMKIRDVTAKLAGSDVNKGVANIVNDIAKSGTQSVKGFGGMYDNIQKEIARNANKTDAVIAKFAKANPSAQVDVDEAFLKIMDDMGSGKYNTVFAEEEAAQKVAENIHKALQKRGLSGMQNVDKIPEIKRTLNEGLELFKKGKFNWEKEPLEQRVGDIAYLELKKKLEDHVPEISEYNSNIHNLINAQKAVQEAAKRTGNKDKIGLTDIIALFGGPGAMRSLLGVEGSTALVGGIPAAAIIGKKALSSGRGASGLITAGQSAQKIPGIGNILDALKYQSPVKMNKYKTATDILQDYNK